MYLACPVTISSLAICGAAIAHFCWTKNKEEECCVYEMRRFRDGLVWTVGLTVEIKLQFQISLAYGGRGLRCTERFYLKCLCTHLPTLKFMALALSNSLTPEATYSKDKAIHRINECIA